MGLTAFDRLDRKTLGVQPTPSHVAARREISELIQCLKLPDFEPAMDEGPIAVATLTAAE